jgi:DNA-directed RNA polymerase subunit RPC12/RpoP
MEDREKASKKGIIGRIFDSVNTKKPGEYDAGGKPVVCPHCGGTALIEEAVSFRTFGLFGEGLFTLACARCGYVQLFLKRPRQRQN